MILFIENVLFNWVITNIPMIGFGIALVVLIVWSTFRVADYRQRFIRLESDSVDLKKDVKTLKKAVIRIDHKLDKLITHLTATKNIDFKD